MHNTNSETLISHGIYRDGRPYWKAIVPGVGQEFFDTEREAIQWAGNAHLFIKHSQAIARKEKNSRII